VRVELHSLVGGGCCVSCFIAFFCMVLYGFNLLVIKYNDGISLSLLCRASLDALRNPSSPFTLVSWHPPLRQLLTAL
jgi:hypothetical protein